MNAEDEIYKRYETELAAIAEEDRAYYRNPAPTIAERVDYRTRHYYLEMVRARLDAELSAVRIAKRKSPSGEPTGQSLLGRAEGPIKCSLA
jgi:hypothetical protein